MARRKVVPFKCEECGREAAFLFAAASAWAACVNLGTATKWQRIDSHKIIIYRGSRAVALLDIPYCFVYSTSDIRIVKNSVCNWEKIILDGEICDIRRVEGL